MSWEFYLEPFTLNIAFAMLLGNWGQVAVAAYIVMSSYYFCDTTKVKLSKVIILVFETQMMCFTAGIIYTVGFAEVTIKTLVRVILTAMVSPFSGHYWFIQGYIIFYLSIPLLNIALRDIKRMNHQRLMIVFGILLFICDFFQIRAFGTLVDFAFIFSITCYIKRYYGAGNRRKSVILTVGCFLSIFAACIILNIFGKYQPDIAFMIPRIFVHWNPLIVCCAISLFWSVKDRKRSGSKIIYTIAPTAFGIYLLHENIYFGGRDSLLWIKILHLDDAVTNPYFVFQLLVSGLIVFLICMVVAFAVRVIINSVCNIKPVHRGLTKVDDWYGGYL